MPRTNRDLKRSWFRRAYINGDVKRSIPQSIDEETNETPREIFDIIPVKPVGRPHDVPSYNRFHSPPRDGADAFKKNTKVAWVDQYYLEEKPEKENRREVNWTSDTPPPRIQSGRGYSAPRKNRRRNTPLSPNYRNNNHAQCIDNRRNHNLKGQHPYSGPYSPRRFLYTPPEQLYDKSPARLHKSRPRSSIDYGTVIGRGGRRDKSPSPLRRTHSSSHLKLHQNSWDSSTPDVMDRSRQYPSSYRNRNTVSHGRVNRYNRSMSHPKSRRVHSADAYSPARLRPPAINGPSRRTQKERAVKGGLKKTRKKPSVWRPVGDPTTSQFRSRPDHYGSSFM